MPNPGLLIHQRVHPNLDVDSCFACRIASVGITPSARGSVRAQNVNQTEREWDRDMPAFKRLKEQGIERPIDGSARAEARADTLDEVLR